ncbi:MAG TPA: hypothetical protein VGA26_01980 [Candidatus Limnocylindria bacterium]
MIFGPGIPWIGLIQEEMRLKRVGQALDAAEAKAHKGEDLRAARERYAEERAAHARRSGPVVGWIGNLLGRLGR